MIITYKGQKFIVYGYYYPAEKGDWFTQGSPHIYEIDKIEFIIGENTCDFTEFFENDMEEIETIILETYYD